MKRAALTLLLALSATAARAELWAYIDGDGVAHFAHEQVDARYSLVLNTASESNKVPGKTDGSSGMLTWLEIAPEVKAVQPWLREAAQASGVDMELLKAVIAVESGFNAKAVSPRGAIGLMQLLPRSADVHATAVEKKTPAQKRLLDPRTNILIGARMLADLTRRFGRIDLALAAWNAGEGAVRKAGGEMPAIDETRAHVQLVLELYWALLQRRVPLPDAPVKMQAPARTATD